MRSSGILEVKFYSKDECECVIIRDINYLSSDFYVLLNGEEKLVESYCIKEFSLRNFRVSSSGDHFYVPRGVLEKEYRELRKEFERIKAGSREVLDFHEKLKRVVIESSKHRVDYKFDPDEEVIAVVPYWQWYNMKEIAIREDLDRGGLYDCRVGAILIWCSPEDKPEGLDIEITRGALKYPREYIAVIYTSLDPIKEMFKRPESVVLYLVVDSFRKSEKVWDWAREKALDLIRRAKEMGERLEAYGYWRCPICGGILKLRIVNNAVEHLAKHEEVKAVVFERDEVVIVFKNGLKIRI